MAKLQKYESSNVQYQAMPNLTDALYQEKLASSSRVDKFLADVGKYATGKATEYATDKAVEDAIRNPITKAQLDQARDTGDNPITSYLKGGTTYNDAIKKVLGQQITGELNLDLQKYHNDVLEDVRLGKITNPEEMLAKLKEPIKAHVEFLNTIDPKIAANYGANATLVARNNYLQGDTIFKNNREKDALVNAQYTTENTLENYSKYLTTHPTATNEAKALYKETVIKMATDTSFSMSRDQLKLKQELIEKLNQVDDKNFADSIAKKHAGQSIGEVLAALDKEKSNAGQHYRDKDLLARESFIRDISNSLARENSIISARDDELQINISDAKEYLKRGIAIPSKLSDNINKNMNPNSRYYRSWKTIEQVSKNINKWNDTPMDTLMADFNALDAKIKDRTTDETVEELQTHETLGGYLKTVIDGLKEDPVGTVLGRSGDFERIDFNDPNNIKAQADKRIFGLNQHGANYGIAKNDPNNLLLSKQESDSFVSQYMKADGNTRIAMLSSLDEGFGDKSSQVMMQLRNNGLPITAELSSFFKNPRLTEKFLSFDSKEERAVIDTFLKDNSIEMKNVRNKVRSELKDFEDIMMMNNDLNTSAAAAKMDNLVTVLSYLAAHDMMVNGTSESKANENAAKLINDSFVKQDTYYIPRIYNGKDISHTIEANGGIIDKAETIKNEYIKKFNPVPFPSKMNVSDKELKRAFYEQIDRTGQWRNTADGSGLIFGVVLSDGSFLPIQNQNGDYLTFKFNDTSYKLPGTDIDMVMVKKGGFYSYGIGYNPKNYGQK